MLPISESQAKTVYKWLMEHFGEEIKAEVLTSGLSFITPELIAAIACQETAYKWLRWIEAFSPETILARCVFDASGDFPGTTRNAFPKNKEDFLSQYPQQLLDFLIDEGNKQRAMPQPDDPGGYNPANYLYKGYGIFQYDLQNIQYDLKFFDSGAWYSFDECLKRLIAELRGKSKFISNPWHIVKMYNGSGTRATVYANNVFQFIEFFK